MESELLQSPLLGLGEEDESDLTDWNLPLAFMKKRHCEKIEGSKSLAQSWRMKDRVMLQGRIGSEQEQSGDSWKRSQSSEGAELLSDETLGVHLTVCVPGVWN